MLKNVLRRSHNFRSSWLHRSNHSASKDPHARNLERRRSVGSRTTNWFHEILEKMMRQPPRPNQPTNSSLSSPNKIWQERLSNPTPPFADASKDGYGAVGYFQNETANTKKTHVSFALAKSRVAPVRKQTILKLELNGAVTAVEIARVVRKEFELDIDSVTFWTDSTTVLH